MAPAHPGEIRLEEFLKPLGLSQYRLAKSIGVPPRRVNEIVLGKRSVSADTALRLARYFGNSPQLWLNLQSQHDLALERDRLGDRLDREVVGHAASARSASRLRRTG
jgi:addiction module HigA family antidote